MGSVFFSTSPNNTVHGGVLSSLRGHRVNAKTVVNAIGCTDMGVGTIIDGYHTVYVMLWWVASIGVDRRQSMQRRVLGGFERQRPVSYGCATAPADCIGGGGDIRR